MKPLGASYTHTYVCTFQSFSYRYGECFTKPLHRGGFVNPLYRGAPWNPFTEVVLHTQRIVKALYKGNFAKPLGALHIQKGLWEAPRSFVHIYILTLENFSLFSYWYVGCFMKPLYGSLCKALTQRGLHNGPRGFPHIEEALWGSEGPHTHVHRHISVFFLQTYGVLHKVPVQRGPCKAPRGFAHIGGWESSTKICFFYQELHNMIKSAQKNCL